MQAPATIAERTAASTLPSESASIANVTPAIAQTPDASPSMPSRKLTMFITATIQTIVESARRSRPACRRRRGTGSVKWSIQTPNAAGSPRRRPGRRASGRRRGRGSRRPRRPRIATAAPSRMPRISPERSRKASAGTRIPRKIASPPSRGIGRRLSRRASGPVDDAEQPRHPADGRSQEHDDDERDRRLRTGPPASPAARRTSAAYFVPYSRSPASPRPGTM